MKKKTKKTKATPADRWYEIVIKHFGPMSREDAKALLEAFNAAPTTHGRASGKGKK